MIEEIVTHGSPVHLDELAAYLLLRDYGEEKLPGVSKAHFRAITKKDNIEELKKREGVVLLGLGGGPFDEHETNGDEEKAKECCATLVSKFLGLDDYGWRKILKYVLHTDKHPPTMSLDLAPTVVRLQRAGWGLYSVINYTDISIKAALEDYKAFSQTSLFKVEEQPITINGNTCFIAIANTDDHNVTKYMRFWGAAVVIVRNSKGQVQVITNDAYHLDVRDVLRLLRMWEQDKKGSTKVPDWKELESKDNIPDVPEWYFHRETNNILNGGFSRPDIPATKLTLNEIVSVVKRGLERRFPKSCEGKCVSSCSWYKLGLLRCRRLRYNNHSH